MDRAPSRRRRWRSVECRSLSRGCPKRPAIPPASLSVPRLEHCWFPLVTCRQSGGVRRKKPKIFKLTPPLPCCSRFFFAVHTGRPHRPRGCCCAISSPRAPAIQRHCETPIAPPCGRVPRLNLAAHHRCTRVCDQDSILPPPVRQSARRRRIPGSSFFQTHPPIGEPL
jgi:hypothetical protein